MPAFAFYALVVINFPDNEKLYTIMFFHERNKYVFNKA